nr:hypothetical protein [Tanacetum cinerariifolium]
VVSRHQNTQQYGAILPIELTTENIRNTKAYKEYYACATGEASPKPKASARRKRSDSDTSITPPTATPTPITTVATAAKGKQPAKEKSPYDPSEVERTKAEQLKIILKRSRKETHISQHGGSSTDKGTDVDAQDKDINDDEGDQNNESDDGKEDDDDDNDDEEEIAKINEPEDTESGGGDEEEIESDEESAEEETREEEEESFDPIPKTPKHSKDDGNGKEDQGLRVSEEQRLIEEDEADELYRDSVNAQLEFEVLTRSSHSSRTSYAVAADQSEMELKKILIEKMEGNKSIQRSDEQQNLYKALVDAYEADKTILESYGDTAILKRRRGDDDDQEGPSAGSDWGSKRRREGREPESASTPSEPAIRSASRSTTGTQSRQMSASESSFVEEPMQTTCQQADSRSSFNELLDTLIDFSNFIMNRLCVDTLTPKLLAGPTYELMRGSCNSLTELEYHLEEVYKATTDQLDWVNPEGQQTMDTTIDQQLAMDEALEFWATATVHHHAIRFKMDTKKHTVNLESFRDMLHICSRFHGQSFDETPFEEEILAFIYFLRHSAAIKTLTDVNINKLYHPWRSFDAIINKCLTGKSSGYDSLRLSQAQILWGLYHKRNINYAYLMWEDFVYQVEHKNHKKSNEMYYPLFTKLIIHHLMSKDLSIPRRNKVNWHYVRDDHMFSTIELPKASVRRTRSSSDTSITPPTAATSPRLTASVKGKQTAKASKAKSLSALSEMKELVLYQGFLMYLLMNQDGDDDDEDDDGEEEYDDDEYAEETRDEESFDPIPQTPENSDDEGNGEEDIGLNIGGEEGHVEEDDVDELYRDVNINQGRGIQANLEVEDSHVTLTLAVKVAVQIQSDCLRDEVQRDNDEFLKTIDENMQKIIKEQVKELVKVQVSKILQRIEQAVNEQLETEVLTQSSHLSKTSYAVAADLSKMELKKVLIEKMEGNKSIQRSDEQRNLYKALVEAYKSDKIILDTYGETVTLKRRQDNDAYKDEEHSAGPDRGSKRRREGKEPDESALAEEPMQTTSQMKEPSHPKFDTGAEDLPIVQSSQHPEWFSQQQKPPSSDRDWNKTVDTLTSELLAGPTYELIKGSCKSLVELKYHLEEVFKATTDHLEWVNLEGQQYPHNLLKPLPLIPNNRGRRVIPFEHFINNDLKYLYGGAFSHLKRKEAYTAYSNPRGFIYQNKDKKNRLMWIDELHKFSDGTLTDVHTALDDRLKGIRMQYLP